MNSVLLSSVGLVVGPWWMGLRLLQLWLYDHVDIGVVPSVCATVGGTLPRIVLRRYARKGLRTCMRGCIRRSGAPGESIKILHGSAVSSALPGELPKFTHVFKLY